MPAPHSSAVLLAALLVPALAAAQAPAPPPAGVESSPLLTSTTPSTPSTAARPLDVGFDTLQLTPERQERECPGCPQRHLAIPYLESIALNILYNAGNHLRGHETARIGPSSWWANMKHGFEWDVNPFGVNQMGHPYQGSNYFTAGRANGLSFWEASSVAAFGSATWEFYFENNRASLNDLVNTTLGGIALGEVLHRTAWLVRDPTASGRSRKVREIVAAAIDPMSGLTRFIAGDASRVVEKPPTMIPSSLAMLVSAGALYQGANLREVSSAARPFLDVDVHYGDVLTGRSRTPYEAFALRVALGGGNLVSESNVRARLLGQPMGGGERYQVTLFQTFDYTVNRAYVFGAQGFEVDAAMTHRWSPRRSVRLSASGGVNALAAVDSLVPAPLGSGASR